MSFCFLTVMYFIIRPCTGSLIQIRHVAFREGASLRQSESKLEPKLNLNLSESKTSPKALQNKKLITQAEHRIGRQFGVDLGQLTEIRGPSK